MNLQTKLQLEIYVNYVTIIIHRRVFIKIEAIGFIL